MARRVLGNGAVVWENYPPDILKDIDNKEVWNEMMKDFVQDVKDKAGGRLQVGSRWPVLTGLSRDSLTARGTTIYGVYYAPILYAKGGILPNAWAEYLSNGRGARQMERSLNKRHKIIGGMY